MKKLFCTVGVSLILLFIAAFAYALHETIPSETIVPLPGPDAAELKKYITTYKPYQSWNLWPGKGRFSQGTTESHGSLLTTFVNDAAFFSLKDNKKVMADGSIIAMENYTADKKFLGLTVMYKINGYNSAAGDWFWVKYSPDDKADLSGKVEMCIECHGKNREHDYIMTGEFKK
jgi:hypothetical protein